MDEILTVQEVADYLKISRTTVWRWCNDGKLPAFKIGRGWRLHRSSVDELIDQQLEQPPQSSIQYYQETGS
jgi:excisionase family DNA binding protein